MNKEISVIIINYNSVKYTINCVNSVLEKTDKNLNYEIIIVDNNSNADDKTQLKQFEQNPLIKLVFSKINLGFAGGNALGVQHGKGKYFFFLNNDCVLLKDGLSIFYNHCLNNPQTGIVSCYTKSEDGDLQYNYSHFPTISSKFFGITFSKLFNKVNYPIKKDIYKDPFKVDLVGGSVMFVNAKTYGLIGGFDTTYFLYSEEEDLALRITNAGYDVVIIPQILIQHFGGKSTEKSLAIKKEFYISFLYFYRKHYGFIKTQLLKKYLFLKLIRKFYLKDVLKLIGFILGGAHLKHSLRHKQKVNF
ncbi:MAG: glycosyltransferase family 2 protein [bacterium]